MADESAKTAEILIAEIVDLRRRAEEAALVAEEASRKANSEAGYAFNAKGAAEKIASELAHIRATIQTDFGSLESVRKRADELADLIASAKVAAEADARICSDARTASEKGAATIDASNVAATQALAAISTASSTSKDAASIATSNAESVTAARTIADSATSVVEGLLTKVREDSTKVAADAATITELSSNAKVQATSLVEVTVAAKETFERVKTYQDTLTILQGDFAILRAKIESLLPGATSAGLASAFHDQQKRFDFPQLGWLALLLLAIAAFFVLGLIDVLPLLRAEVGSSATSWDAILRHFTLRLPVIIPVVWLALYAGRHYSTAVRMQEDYAYKETVSRAFEGYRREMATIGDGNAEGLSPLIALCANVLHTVAQRPGRLYESKHDDITPFTPLWNGIGDTWERMKGGAKNGGTKEKAEG